MLKVKTEQIRADYVALQEAKEANLANIEAQVRPFALSLGYDEEKTKGLIDYVQKQNGNGLSDKDAALLEILSSYIDDVEEHVDEVEESDVSQVSLEDFPLVGTPGNTVSF